MDVSYCSPLQLQEDASGYLFDCDALLDKSCNYLAYDPSSDSGYFSACSSLSPTSSVDSFCFSPNSLQVKTNQDPLDCFIFGNTPAPQQTIKILPHSGSTTSATKKSRSRYPGKKRQTASEREKLRMRDLTKALHHLRSYLPASVAPAGQALTKIETLRLTIHYISHLSAQLGLTEDVLEQRNSSGSVEKLSAVNPTLDQAMCSFSPNQETQNISSMQPACSSDYESLLPISNGPCYAPQQYPWPQQQYSHVGFSGQC